MPPKRKKATSDATPNPVISLELLYSMPPKTLAALLPENDEEQAQKLYDYAKSLLCGAIKSLDKAKENTKLNARINTEKCSGCGEDKLVCEADGDELDFCFFCQSALCNSCIYEGDNNLKCADESCGVITCKGCIVATCQECREPVCEDCTHKLEDECGGYTLCEGCHNQKQFEKAR